MQDRQAVLFERWEAHWQALGIQAKFVPDGPADWQRWPCARPRVLWVLREPNDTGSDRYNLADFLFDPPFLASPPERRRVEATSSLLWRNALRRTYGLLHDADYDASERLLTVEPFWRDLAVINLKKAAGGGVVRGRTTIRDWALQDAPFITEQLELLRPSIILCGGTFTELCGALGVSTKRECLVWRNSEVIAGGHPSQPGLKREIEAHHYMLRQARAL